MLSDGLSAKRLQISGWLVAEDRKTPYDGSEPTPNPLQEQTAIRVWLLSADVRLTRRFGAQITATVPDVTRSAVVTLPSNTINFSETFRGIGDTAVLGWFRMVKARWIITANGGASLPTGKTEEPRFQDELNENSLVPVSRLQRGTGTFDPIGGITVNRVLTTILPPGIRMFASAAARVPVAENKFGLRTGASFEVAGGVSREIKWHALVGIFRAGWLHREQDVFKGTPVLVGGGDWVFIAPAVAVAVGPVTLQAEIKLPIYRHLANRQLDAARSFQVGVVWPIF